ncbi:MAG: BTAD domain-containing putative transcriptional regulator [Actinomycetota bacterium]
MEYRILGPIAVDRRGEAIELGSPRQRALLTLLLLHRNRVVTTSRILEELWPGDPVGKERTLWVYVSRLRAILEPERPPNARNTVLLTRDQGYSLEVDDDSVDAVRFETLATQGSQLVRDDPTVAADLIAEGLALWRGAALEDVAYEDFARAEAARLEELRLKAIEDRLDAELQANRHRDIVGELERLTVDHPLRERLVHLQVLALYRSGRQADALRAIARHRELIAEELGLEPSPELQRLEEQVLLHDRALAPPDAGAEDREPDAVANPFVGLRPFDQGDSADFHGRDGLVTQLVSRLERGARLVALVGASGSGKSSVLGAGFVPAIRAGAIAGSDRWLVVRMVPGNEPFLELTSALRRADVEGAATAGADLVDSGDDGLLRACQRRRRPDRPTVLLVIDQFEELFTLGSSPDLRARFVRNLEVAVDDAAGDVLVAIALRADFYAAPLAHPRFATQIAEGIVNVVPLTLDELEAAAARPAERAGMTLEPALLVHLLADVAGETGGLPLFQYALTELFERRAGRTLTLTEFRAMGGVSGALARRAEDLFLGLDEPQRRAAKQILLRMVTITDRDTWSRRRLTATELLELDAEPLALQAVLDRLGAHRLVTFDRDPVTGSPTVEVAHEALLSEWPRLQQWIRDGEDDVRQHARLAAAHAEWRTAGEHDDYLLTGERLADYEQWAVDTIVLPTSDERRFLQRSVEHRRHQQDAERERNRESARLTRQARWLLAIAAALLVTGVGAVVLALPGDDPPRIVVIQGPAAGDTSVADMIVSGRRSAERASGIEIDLEPTLVEAEEHLRSVAASGPDLVIVPKEFDFDLEQVAADHPEVHWVALDPVAIHEDFDNVTEIHFDVEHSAFLAGAAAAWRTRTDTVGFVGGLQSFRAERSRNGFEQGVAFERPVVGVRAAYLGPVASPLAEAERRDDLAYELAMAMFGDGADIVFHDAGDAGAGVVRAAAELRRAGREVWAIGSNVDHFQTVSADQRSVVLASTVKRFDIAVTTAVDRFLAGELEAGDLTLGIGEGGVDLADSGGHLTGIAGRIRSLEEEIAADHLPVSPHAATAPGWQATPDVAVELTMTDDGCAVTDVDGGRRDGDELLIERGDRLHVELANESSQIGGLALRVLDPGMTIERLRVEAQAGIPDSFGSVTTITRVQLGGDSASAAVIDAAPIALNCFLPDRDFVVMIARPT